MLIEILGTIGVGKSTLLDAFPDEAYTKVREPVEDNPWLAAFYAEIAYLDELRKIGNTAPARTTPMMECYMAARRKNELTAAIVTGKPVVTDFGRPAVFARILKDQKKISGLDYRTFLEVWKAVDVRPNLVIFLRGVDSAFERMQKRGRDCEKKVTREYLKQLEDAYLSEIRQSLAALVILEWPGKLADVEQMLGKMNLPTGLKWKDNAIAEASKQYAKISIEAKNG